MKVLMFPFFDMGRYSLLGQIKKYNNIDNCIFFWFDSSLKSKYSTYECKTIDVGVFDAFSDSERDRVLNDYIGAIGLVSAINSVNKEWWATDTSSKSRLLAPTQEILNQIMVSLRLIKKYKNSEISLCLVGMSWPAIIFIEGYCLEENIEIRSKWMPLSKIRSRVKESLRVWNYFFRGAVSSLIRIIKTRYYFGKNINIDSDKPVFLIKSWTFKSSFLAGNGYFDPFCGDLAKYSKEYLSGDTQVVTIAQGFVDRYTCYKNMKNVGDRAIFPTEVFITISDFITASFSMLVYLLFKKIKVPKYSQFMGYNLSPMLQELVNTSGRFIRFGEYLHYYLGRRIALQYKLQGCLMSYEGNHWEKLFILGIRSTDKEVKIIGYYHSAIPQAAAGVFLSNNDVSITPSPDIVITSGHNGSKILKKYSSLPSHKIYSGCALLYQYLYDLKTVSRGSGLINSVLVMLEGVFDAGLLLKYAINQAKHYSNIKFIIRSHPALPLPNLIKHIGQNISELPSNIKISKNIKVIKDIEECDVGLYWGTATAVEALMIGMPIIWFDRGDVLSYDPLFDFNDFKWTVRFETPICVAIDKINNLTNEEYNSRALKGRQYVSQYFEKCSKTNVGYFFYKFINI
jgi:hypothetical protein